MRYIIGMGMIALGGILFAVTEFIPFIFIMFIGVFLFASFLDSAAFVDYVIVPGHVAILRKRYYILFLPFVIISKVLTLNRSMLKIVYKEEYYKATNLETPENLATTRISRKEYIALRNAQRKIYATRPLSREFMEKFYTPQEIGLKQKKNRLILASVFAALMLTTLVEPEGIYITVIYETIFVPMILLWIPDYKDAKILQQAYDRAVGEAFRLP